MPWTPEERGFIQKIKTRNTVESVTAQVQAEFQKGLQGFIGRPDTPELRAQMQAYADSICARYNTAMGHLLPGDFKIVVTTNGGT